MEIERVDDEQGARAFFELEASTTPIDHPGSKGVPLDDVLGLLSSPMPTYQIDFYLGRLDGEVVATGFFGMPMLENTHVCQLYVIVAIDRRRRGLGVQMSEFLFEEGRRRGRRLADWSTGAPLDGTSGGDALSERLGAAPVLVQHRRQLALGTLDRIELERRLEELTAGASASYELRSWQNRCPDDLVDGVARMVPIVMSDAPQGTRDLEVEHWDAVRYREDEETLAARRRDSLVTVAVERASGRVVAYTQLNVPHSDHSFVTQLGTAVEPAHRGHRLGLAVKLANLRSLLDTHPDAAVVETHNAAENAHMIEVNDALGFRALERSTTWQLDL